MTQKLTIQETAAASKPEPTRGTKQISPRVDICETPQELTLFAHIPGVLPENIHLHLHKGDLTLLGKVEPRPEAGKLLLDETRTGDYFRVFSISKDLDSEKIQADYKLGVLIIHLPKVKAAEPREIKVQID